MLTGVTQGKSKLSLIFMTAGGFAIWSKLLTEVRLLPSYRIWQRGGWPFLINAFQRNGSQVLEKAIPGTNLDRDLRKNYISRSRELIYNGKFLSKGTKKMKVKQQESGKNLAPRVKKKAI